MILYLILWHTLHCPECTERVPTLPLARHASSCTRTGENLALHPSQHCERKIESCLHILPHASSVSYWTKQFIYLINQVRGPYWENIGPRSWQNGSSAARSVQKRPRADILPVRSRASLVNKRFITRLKKAKTAKTQARDHSRQYPVQYLENIGPAIEHFDWLILVIGPSTAWVV